jgi:ubiquinone/menaquinone biosynthesis C-methylase UbiE
MTVVYTVWVHWICHPLAWGVSNRWLRRAYRTWAGQVHLCVGPGNGRLLRWLSKRVRVLHLLDSSKACLALGVRAVRRRAITPHGHLQDVLTAWKGLPDNSIDSIDCVMVVHCLRGASIADKIEFFHEAYRVLKKDGVLFGATIVSGGTGVRVNAFARKLMDIYNDKKGWFDNRGDTSDDLETALRAIFPHVESAVQACTFVFKAVK